MTEGLLVFQSDFGINDGAVSAMHGVANSVKRGLPLFDLTHQIPQYNIWEASYRLLQTINYWPSDTVFVSIVDPGVGSDRRSVVVKTVKDQYIVTPDNGTLTHVNRFIGIKEVREIDESKNRLPKSGESHTFHGRDIFAYTGARLAAGEISLEDIGPSIPLSLIVELPLKETIIEDNCITGVIDVIDRPFGNLWTNIRRLQFKQLDVTYGDAFEVSLTIDGELVYEGIVTYGRSFAAAGIGEALMYVNSLDNIGIALNQGSFADTYQVLTGSSTEITIRKAAIAIN
ncbi:MULTISPECIES: SAM hydrolase/SAM-dependent halogenase family protein [Psychrobacillus]|uniref:S-adenosyl-l-methionine hydroxide adenosyltransferase family protein n=1 Tax=Psychrobacillus faecigallinarum TaxID=2762235 RepID=A0ABR8RC87_9BACI|nr:S-adenosyl-l-methionine hydroxide adenosyltransferase family protein [Psychrobacillus faecigallinarum]MBD7945420.1 S-adenosyl-l-methionine hydroxide adenosyltransferase family protein [Psychrobacillus faecigallinarum]QGM32175.1 DNA-directed RNA polymerase subunit delta [Bacillus sp. N3536]